ncbi:MAG TPA: rRNA maturation RNase YbeY [Xanthomonadales bacterium]|nr:rRNA maturation RNase YbeY [Xanthomonadales bacterium]
MSPPKQALSVIVQRRVRAAHVPRDAQFRRWIEAALEGSSHPFEVTIRVVGAAESRRLNARYRDSDRATNVLSFNCDLPEVVQADIERRSGHRPLGDLVICAPRVLAEARQQGKDVSSHWAHLTVHGILHLLGHDHELAGQAAEMEKLEVGILTRLGIPDPYQPASR